MTRAETTAWVLRKYGEDVTVDDAPCKAILSRLNAAARGSAARWHCVLPANVALGTGSRVRVGTGDYLAESCGQTSLAGKAVCSWAVLKLDGAFVGV